MSFTDFESSQRDERTGEVGFFLRALLVVLRVAVVYLGPAKSQPIEPYGFGIVWTRGTRW